MSSFHDQTQRSEHRARALRGLDAATIDNNLDEDSYVRMEAAAAVTHAVLAVEDRLAEISAHLRRGLMLQRVALGYAAGEDRRELRRRLAEFDREVGW